MSIRHVWLISSIWNVFIISTLHVYGTLMGEIFSHQTAVMSLRHYQAEKPIAMLEQNTKYVLSAADTLAAITSAVNPPCR